MNVKWRAIGAESGHWHVTLPLAQARGKCGTGRNRPDPAKWRPHKRPFPPPAADERAAGPVSKILTVIAKRADPPVACIAKLLNSFCTK